MPGSRRKPSHDKLLTSRDNSFPWYVSLQPHAPRLGDERRPNGRRVWFVACERCGRRWACTKGRRMAGATQLLRQQCSSSPVVVYDSSDGAWQAKLDVGRWRAGDRQYTAALRGGPALRMRVGAYGSHVNFYDEREMLWWLQGASWAATFFDPTQVAAMQLAAARLQEIEDVQVDDDKDDNVVPLFPPRR